MHVPELCQQKVQHSLILFTHTHTQADTHRRTHTNTHTHTLVNREHNRMQTTNKKAKLQIWQNYPAIWIRLPLCFSNFPHRITTSPAWKISSAFSPKYGGTNFRIDFPAHRWKIGRWLAWKVCRLMLPAFPQDLSSIYCLNIGLRIRNLENSKWNIVATINYESMLKPST